MNTRDIPRMSPALPQPSPDSISLVDRLVLAAATITHETPERIRTNRTRDAGIHKARSAIAAILHDSYQSWGYVADITGWWTNHVGALLAGRKANPDLVARMRHLVPETR